MCQKFEIERKLLFSAVYKIITICIVQINESKRLTQDFWLSVRLPSKIDQLD
jgi:hypothetical protein